MRLPLPHEPGIWPDPWSRMDSRTLEQVRYIPQLPVAGGWIIPSVLSSTSLFHTVPEGKVAVLVSVLQECTWSQLADTVSLLAVLPPLKVRVGNRGIVSGPNFAGDEGAAEVKAVALSSVALNTHSGFIQVERLFAPVFIPSGGTLFLESQGPWISDSAISAVGTYDIRIIQGEPVPLNNWLRFLSPVFWKADK